MRVYTKPTACVCVFNNLNCCTIGAVFGHWAMYGETSSSRSRKGTVAVKNHRGNIQLIWSYQSKRYYLSLGVPYTKQNLPKAEQTASAIESDMLWGQFDTTLVKYNPSSYLRLEAKSPNLHYLWKQFVEHKSKTCCPNTMKTQYQAWTNHLGRIPHHDLLDTKPVLSYCQANLSADAYKRLVVHLSACCNWAIKRGLIKTNPFKDIPSDIKLAKNEDEWNIKPFTLDERNAILEAVRDNKFKSKYSAYNHNHYYPFLWFLFHTGCRPSEAIGLEWQHITDNYRFIRFEQVVIKHRNGVEVQPTLKTQAKRTFPSNPEMVAMLQTQNSQATSSIVFPGHRGGWLDPVPFKRTVWRPVLAGLGLEPRKLYQTRHSYITYCLDAGVSVQQVSKWVGNTPEIIWKHYAGCLDQIIPPTL